MRFLVGLLDPPVEDGAFYFQLRLGETRCERFYMALDKKAGHRTGAVFRAQGCADNEMSIAWFTKEDQAIFPWHPSGLVLESTSA